MSDKYVDYQKLLNGGTYEPDDDGNLISFTGVKTVLSYYAYARILKKANSTLTRTGLHEKSTNQSLDTDIQEVTMKISSTLSVANQLKTEFVRFIEKYPEIYTLYPKKETVDLQKTGVRFFGIKKY